MSDNPAAAGATPATGATPDAAQTATQPGATPAVSATPAHDPQAPTTSQDAMSDDEEPRDPKAILAAYRAAQQNLQALRKKSQAEAKELDTLRAERQAAEDAKLSEQARLQKESERLRAELDFEKQQARDRVNRYEVQLQAQRLGIVDPDAAVKLLDWSGLDYDEDGSPKDVDKALKLLLKDKPYLAGQPASPVAATNGATRAQVPGARIYSRADLSNYEYYTKNRDDIQAAYREGRIVD